MVPRPNIQTILYASDLGAQTRPVFRMAVSLARRYDARVLMIHVVPPLGNTAQTILDTYLSPEDAKKVHQEGLRKYLEMMKERLEKFGREELVAYDLKRVPVTDVIVVSGSYPSEEILRVADKHHADIIVMGKSSRGVVTDNVLGTTASRVLRGSHVPVFLVPNAPLTEK